jgi:putative CocE/NonD family hydrolase
LLKGEIPVGKKNNLRSIFVSLLTVCLVSVYFGGCKSESSGVEVRRDVKIAMRDGVELSANVFLPKAKGKYPVILLRTPYGKGNVEEEGPGHYYASQGYVYIVQDCRGTGQSKGQWEPVVNEKQDGLDTHKWVLEQGWCNGKLGTLGGSYLGYTQWITAPYVSESVKAMFTVVPLIEWYYNCSYIGGAFQLQTMMGWGSGMVRPTEGEGAGVDWENWDWEKAYRKLPLCRWDENIGFEVKWMRDWVGHPSYDEYWAKASMTDSLEDFRVPNITISGWYDLFVKQALDYVPAVREKAKSEKVRRHNYVIVGPWGHGINSVVGKLDYGKEAEIDMDEIQLKWFDHWLKGEETGIEEWPAFRIFVMGHNEWRDEEEWPLARTQYTPYYFHSSGKANSSIGDGKLSEEKPSDELPDMYVYDPDNPVPTHGGCLLFGEAGALDQSEIEKRKDILVFTSEELKEELEVTGPVKVVLYASSTARDTDFTAKLCDIHPDGRSFNLCDGIIRTRYRESAVSPTLIKGGEIYRYEIDLWATSNVFLAGHRIRVEMSSSNFPRFDRNPNTGHAFGADEEVRKATQVIYHDAERTSHIVLPVIRKKTK